MERTNVATENVGDLYIENKRDTGVLDNLSIEHQVPLSAYFYPERGITRLYASLLG